MVFKRGYGSHPMIFWGGESRQHGESSGRNKNVSALFKGKILECFGGTYTNIFGKSRIIKDLMLARHQMLAEVFLNSPIFAANLQKKYGHTDRHENPLGLGVSWGGGKK